MDNGYSDLLAMIMFRLVIVLGILILLIMCVAYLIYDGGRDMIEDIIEDYKERHNMED